MRCRCERLKGGGSPPSSAVHAAPHCCLGCANAAVVAHVYGEANTQLYHTLCLDVQLSEKRVQQQSRAAVTLTKRIGPHELIPVKCEVFVLIVVVIQQLPNVLLSPQNLCMSCLTVLMQNTFWCIAVGEPLEDTSAVKAVSNTMSQSTACTSSLVSSCGTAFV